MTPDLIEEDQLPKKHSSWRGALSQLPGFPSEERLPAPSLAGAAARAVSSGIAEDDEELDEQF